MGKPTESISCRNEIQRACDGLLKVFTRASSYPSQKTLQFGESFFYRREIRRVCRQKQEATAASFNGLLYTR